MKKFAVVSVLLTVIFLVISILAENPDHDHLIISIRVKRSPVDKTKLLTTLGGGYSGKNQGLGYGYLAPIVPGVPPPPPPDNNEEEELPTSLASEIAAGKPLTIENNFSVYLYL